MALFPACCRHGSVQWPWWRDNIWQHGKYYPGSLAARVNYYKLFHTGDVLKDAEWYFKFGMYSDNIPWCNGCCHNKSSQVEPHNISERTKRRHIKFLSIAHMQQTKRFTWNLHMILVMWLTTIMKPYCSLINLQRHREEKVTIESTSQHLGAGNKPRWCRWCDWPDRCFWDDDHSVTRLCSI